MTMVVRVRSIVVSDLLLIECSPSIACADQRSAAARRRSVCSFSETLHRFRPSLFQRLNHFSHRTIMALSSSLAGRKRIAVFGSDSRRWGSLCRRGNRHPSTRGSCSAGNTRGQSGRSRLAQHGSPRTAPDDSLCRGSILSDTKSAPALAPQWSNVSRLKTYAGSGT